MKRRSTAILGVMCLMAALATSASGRPDATPKIIGTVTACVNIQNVAMLPMLYGVKARIMQKHGLGVKFVVASGGPACLQLVSTGQANFAIAHWPDMIGANRRGADLRVATGNFDRNLFQLACLPSAGVSGSYPGVMSQLIGKKVGTASPTGALTVYFSYTLQRVGIDPSRLQIVSLGAAPNYLAALQARLVDCAILLAPMQHGGPIKDLVQRPILNWGAGQGPPALQNIQANSTLVSQKWASGHPRMLKAWRDAMVETLAVIRNPQNLNRIARTVTADYPGLTQQEMRAFVADVQKAVTKAPTARAMSQQQFRNAVEVFRIFNPTVPVDDLTLSGILVR